MAFIHPWFLVLMPVAALALFAASRGSLADLTAAQRRACAFVRMALLGCVVLALAGARWRWTSDRLGVLFVVDDSASISPEARAAARHFVASSLKHRRARDEAGVLGFARHTAVWQPPAATSELTRWPDTAGAERTTTDIGGALAFAGSVLPPDRTRRIVLLTDGNDTADTGLLNAARLGRDGVEVDTVPLRNPWRPEVLVASVDLPGGLRSGEPFDLHADVESNVVTGSRVNLYQNQFLAGQREATLKPGHNDIVFPNVRAADGFTPYEVEIFPAADTRLENNRAGATVALGGNPHVLLVAGDESKAAPLAGALREARIDVEVRGPAGLPRSLSELQHFDLFMLSDVSALQMTHDQMELYRTWVQQFGGGFIMVGGENSFGVGGYFRTPIESMLPVRMDHDDRQETPGVALYVVLDRSGSMTAPVAGTTKIALADQGAVLAMNVLQGHDLFGLTAVDTQVNNVVPLAQITGKSADEKKILAITAGGGGIYIFTGLADAFRVMRAASAKIKHVILFSDAADAEEKASGEMPDGAPAGSGNSADLVSAMLASKITTSVVGLGGAQDKDVPFLRMLAERGNGRFYQTEDATTLPRIFSMETMKVAQSSLVEEPFNPVLAAPSALTAGLDWKTCPPLLGYHATKPKPGADVALATETGEPLLASWRYGLGLTAAFTSDADARWAAEWLGWDGFGKFWAQVVRGLLRKDEQTNFQVRATEIDGGRRLRLDIDALTPDGAFRDRLPIDVTGLEPSTGQTRTVHAEQVAPGSYRAEFDLPAPAGALGSAPSAEATTMFSVSSPGLLERPYVFGHTRSYPREFLRSDLNEGLLRAAAAAGHGTFEISPDRIFAPPTHFSVQWEDLTNYFLAAALILLPLDIFLRRRIWKQPSASPQARPPRAVVA